MKWKILVIDDEPQIERLFQRLFGDEVCVVAATQVMDALELTRTQSFDAIVCDLHLPKLSGVDFYERLARQNPGYEEKIVFLTGGFTAEKTQRFFDGINNPLVLKPFELSELYEAVEAVAAVPTQ